MLVLVDYALMAAMLAVGVQDSGATASAAPPPGIVVARDTPVELMAMTEVSTATATPGTIIKLRVNRAIEIDGRTIIPVGTPAFGEVTAAKGSGGLGKSGRMSARLVRIQFGDATIPIEGAIDARGTGAGSAGVAIVLVGVAGLFHRGNNAKIKAGEILSGFVTEDVAIDLLPTPHRVGPASADGAVR